MGILSPILPEHWGRTNKTGAIIFLLLGFLGFLDASYLTIERLRGTLPWCSVVKGCDQVLTSSYSEFEGIPLSIIGLIYYTVVIAGSLLYLDIENRRVLHGLSAFTLFGIGASIYFVYLQLFVIHSICTYCMFSALLSLLLFSNGLYLYGRTRPWRLFNLLD